MKFITLLIVALLGGCFHVDTTKVIYLDHPTVVIGGCE